MTPDLLRQPDGFEGLGLTAEEVPPHDLAIARTPNLPDLLVHRRGALDAAAVQRARVIVRSPRSRTSSMSALKSG